LELLLDNFRLADDATTIANSSRAEGSDTTIDRRVDCSRRQSQRTARSNSWRTLSSLVWVRMDFRSGTKPSFIVKNLATVSENILHVCHSY
jgi:hypothetical protein